MSELIKIEKLRKTKKITLPHYEGSEIEIYDSVAFGEVSGIKGNKDADSAEYFIKFIKDWNLTEDGENKLEITAENLNGLRADDVAYILEQIADFLGVKVGG